MFRVGNRWLAAGCLVLLLEAAAHTIGTLSPPPGDPQVQSLLAGMQALRTPMGFGMAPSVWDVTRGLAFFMTIALVALGVLGLTTLAAAPDHRRLHRAIAAVLLAANAAMLVLWWVHQLLPPLAFQVIIVALFVVALVRR